MTGKVYRVLGGPKHGELFELEENQKTLTVVLPERPITAYSTLPNVDEIFRVKTMVYEIAKFSFPHAGNEVKVLVPKESSDSMKEWYLTRFIEGMPV